MRRSYHKLRTVRQGCFTPAGGAPPGDAVADLRLWTANYLLREHEARYDLRRLADRLAALVPAPFGIAVDRLSFLHPESSKLPALPAGYAFKGGAARCALSEALRRPSVPPRDLDLVRLGRRWRDLDGELSRKYMPADFERGHGVELTISWERYFSSRDISINEVLYSAGVVQASTIAVLDHLSMVLRPCFYRSGTLHREAALRGRTVLKMLRLLAQGLVLGQPWLVVGIPESFETDDFDLALELDKAFSHGLETAERFVRLCAECELVELRGEDSLCTLLCELSSGLFGGLDFFLALPPGLRERCRAKM